MENCSPLLEASLKRAQKNLGDSFIQDEEISARVVAVVNCPSNRAGVRLLMACMLAKVHRPEIDPRKSPTRKSPAKIVSPVAVTTSNSSATSSRTTICRAIRQRRSLRRRCGTWIKRSRLKLCWSGVQRRCIKMRWANAFLVKNGDRFFLFNEKGDLIIAKLSPKGYEETSRAHLLEPTNTAAGRDVLWSHPAFANRCMYARNDKEIISVSLAAPK